MTRNSEASSTLKSRQVMACLAQAIRFSDSETAEHALAKLGAHSPSGPLLALTRTIIEDVGIVNPALLALAGDLAGRIVHAGRPPVGWLLQQGTLDAALSVKCRCAPDLLVIARHEPRLAEARAAAGDADEVALLRMMGMRSVHVGARAIALLTLWSRLEKARGRGDLKVAEHISLGVQRRLRAPRWLYDVVSTLSALGVSDATPLLLLVWSVSGATADGRIALPFDQPPRQHRTALSFRYDRMAAAPDGACRTGEVDDDEVIIDFLRDAPAFARSIENATDGAVATPLTAVAITRAVIARMETLRVHQRHFHPGTLDILTQADDAALVASGAEKGHSVALFDAFAPAWPILNQLRCSAARRTRLTRVS